MDRRGRQWSLARQLLVLQIVVIVIVVGGGALLAALDASRDAEDTARRQVTATAITIADSPVVLAALDSGDPTATLQPYAERIRRDVGVDFVTIMSPQGIRYTHPDPTLIGKNFLGNTARALRGETFTETYVGTLGPSVRTVAPIFDEQRRIRALVAVGITVEAISTDLRRELIVLLMFAVLALGIGGIGTFLVSRRLNRQTHGLGPSQLGQMYDYYEAVLHTVREGLLLLDRHRVLVLANDEARRLLDLPSDAEGKPITDLGLPPTLTDTLTSGRHGADEIHLTRDRVVVLNQSPTRSDGRDLGTVVTLRDHTELQTLTGELDSVRGFAESLRSVAHESANRLHTVISLIELGRADEAIEFATADLRSAQQLTNQVVGAVDEPVLAALLLGKSAEANERGIDLGVTADTQLGEIGIEGSDLVTILGNLIDNAFDAAADADPPRWVKVGVRTEDDMVVIRVADSGPGVDPDDVQQAFRRGWSTKADDRLVGRGLGLALVGQTVHRYGGTIDIGRETGAVFTVWIPLTGRSVP